MSVINTNYLALVSQNNLTKSQNSLGTAIERLSSGLRINSAKDDAAGQAIANRFTANINGLSQASRNANDGISIAQTTEGALNEINENLQRVRTLTVQATNGSNSSSDLQSIQNEIDERLEEINRISEQTQFNGVKVLSATNDLKIQVGANDGETIDIGLKKIDSGTLGLGEFNVSGTSGAITSLTHKSAVGVTTSADVDLSGVTGFPTGSMTLHGYGKYTEGTGDNAGTWENYALQDAKGNYYAITNTNANFADSTHADFGKVTVAFADQAALDAAKNTYNVASEAGNAATANPLQALDDALKGVDSLRSELGAVQNRFQSTIANLNNTVNNLSAARSRIEDADYAVEVSNMTRAQILQQAGTSVLAQANQVPQTVLSLLR